MDAFELWCWRRLLESPLDCKEIQPVHPKGNQSWIFIGRTDAEGEAPVLWPPDVKNGLIGKYPNAGKDWKQEDKGMTEDEMFGWHHWLSGHEFEQALGVGDGQGSLACCSPCSCKESDTTEQLNWTEHKESRGLHSLGLWRGWQPAEAPGVGAPGSTMLGCAAAKTWDMQKGREKCKTQENADRGTSKTHQSK